jgi:Antibiotic biosynthesis monooxygenase
MFIAMNRFRVAKGSEAAFEQVWLSRDSHLDKVPGFVEFHLLKGPEAAFVQFQARWPQGNGVSVRSAMAHTAYRRTTGAA